MSSHGHGRISRLKGWNYRNPGPYFVTLVVLSRAPILARVVRTGVELTELGQMVDSAWQETSVVRPEITVDCYVTMPDHTHAIVSIDPSKAPESREPHELGRFIGAFKATTANRINRSRGTPGAPLWQAGFYDRVIRNDPELAAFRQYVKLNPVRAALERYPVFPSCL